VIGIAGENPFGPALEEVIRGERVGGHPLQVQIFRPTDDLDRCQVLFIGAAEAQQVNSWLAKVKGLPVLTVSELEGFAQHGGMINFVIEDKKLRFQVNPAVATKAGLKISSKLLRLAIVVSGGGSETSEKKP